MAQSDAEKWWDEHEQSVQIELGSTENSRCGLSMFGSVGGGRQTWRPPWRRVPAAAWCDSLDVRTRTNPGRSGAGGYRRADGDQLSDRPAERASDGVGFTRRASDVSAVRITAATGRLPVSATITSASSSSHFLHSLAPQHTASAFFKRSAPDLQISKLSKVSIKQNGAQVAAALR